MAKIQNAETTRIMELTFIKDKLEQAHALARKGGHVITEDIDEIIKQVQLTIDTPPLIEEGDKCPKFGPSCCGRMKIKSTENCSCHINPPCSGCVSAGLVCDDCGHEVEAAA